MDRLSLLEPYRLGAKKGDKSHFVNRQTITINRALDTEGTERPSVKEGDRGGPPVTAAPPDIGITASKAIAGQVPSASTWVRAQRSRRRLPSRRPRTVTMGTNLSLSPFSLGRS